MAAAPPRAPRAASPCRGCARTSRRGDGGSAPISERAASHSAGEGNGSGTGLGATCGGGALGRGPPGGDAVGNDVVGGAGSAVPRRACWPSVSGVGDHGGVSSATGADAVHRSGSGASGAERLSHEAVAGVSHGRGAAGPGPRLGRPDRGGDGTGGGGGGGEGTGGGGGGGGPGALA